MQGLMAYKTFNAISMHYNENIAYDAWKYNFKTKVSEESFKAKRSLIWQYAKIERDFPTLKEQIKFFWPAISSKGFVRASAVAMMRKQYLTTIQGLDTLESRSREPYARLARRVGSVDKLFDFEGPLPIIYRFFQEEEVDYDVILLTFMLFRRGINRIVSREDLIFDQWRSRINKDVEFFNLYFDRDAKSALIQSTYDIFQQQFK